MKKRQVNRKLIRLKNKILSPFVKDKKNKITNKNIEKDIIKEEKVCENEIKKEEVIAVSEKPIENDKKDGFQVIRN